MATILIVDDSQTFRAAIAKTLAGEGHECLEASDGNEGVTLAKLHHPALVLLDIVMDNCDGFRACRLLKREPTTKDIPVVLVSVKVGDSDEMWGRKMGAADYLRKPVSPEVLLECIRRFV